MADDGSGRGLESGKQALQQGRTQDAIALLQQALEDDSASFEAKYLLGVALAQAGRSEDAVSHLTQARDMNPGVPQVHYNLGLACLNAQKFEDARSAFQSALQLNPDYAQAQVALDRLPPRTSTTSVPAVQPTADATLALTVAQPASEQTAFPSVEGGVYDPTVPNLVQALAFGIVTALIGAFVWDKFVFYTNFKFGLISAFIGVAVGIAVSTGSGGKSSPALQFMGGLLAGLGILLGEALIGVDVMRSELAKQNIFPGFFDLLMLSIRIVPSMLANDPLSLVFVAFGIYEGWKIPGKAKES